MGKVRFADERIAQWLDANTYHPRSDKHGKNLCRYFLDDLLRESELLQKHAQERKIVYDEDLVVGQGALRWNVDLVLGPPSQHLLGGAQRLVQGEPREIWLAIDAKSVMTEHVKARRNRQRDLNSLAGIMKHHHPKSVVGGLMLVNMAPRFKSPLRDDVTIHNNIERLVAETVEMFDEIPRARIEGGAGIEAVGVIVVEHTNLPGDRTRLITEPPAPQVGDLAFYRTALNTLQEALESRFLT